MKTVTVNGKTMIDRPVACAMLAFDGDNVILVEQDRGTFGNILEIPAGKVNEGEEPKDCAMREFTEETGYTALECYHLTSYYPSVGYSTERIDVFATTNLSKIVLEQRLDDNEKVKVVRIPHWKFDLMVRDGSIKDSKAMMALYAWSIQ